MNDKQVRGQYTQELKRDGSREDGARHRKKFGGVYRAGGSAKYAWIRKMKACGPVSLSCEVLGVSVSGYFVQQRRQQQRRSSQPSSCSPSDEALLAHICAIHAELRQEYSWPRMTKGLCARGHRVGKGRVRRLMQQHGLKDQGRHKFVVTTESKHKLLIAPDLLQRDFEADSPNLKWTGDITYIATDQGWLYLAAVMDLHSRMIVDWSMQAHMRASLLTQALSMAWFRRRPAPGLIVETDRGSQYCGDAFQKALTGYGMRSSMSRKGDRWDNAPTESLWGRLNVGSLHGCKLATRRQAVDEVIDWIASYSHWRQHSMLGYVSPRQCAERWVAAQLNKIRAHWTGLLRQVSNQAPSCTTTSDGGPLKEF
jgi:putative transposase